MKRKSRGNSRLFFIEFLIVLFFFLITSTICLKLFVQAHQITEHSDDLAHAQTMAASAAELLLAGYDPEEVLLICADESQNEANGSSANKEYCMQIAESGSDAETAYDTETVHDPESALDTETAHAADSVCTTYIITVSNQDAEPIYKLEITTHTPLTRKEALS